MNSNDKDLSDKDKKIVNEGYEKVFDYLLEKLEKEYSIFNKIYIKMKEKRSAFYDLEDTDKKSVINGLINLMETGQGNLKAIGLKEREGRMNGKTFRTKNLLTMTFIDKSVTGIYERRYKINGVENCSSK